MKEKKEKEKEQIKVTAIYYRPKNKAIDEILDAMTWYSKNIYNILIYNCRKLYNEATEKKNVELQQLYDAHGFVLDWTHYENNKDEINASIKEELCIEDETLDSSLPIDKFQSTYRAKFNVKRKELIAKHKKTKGLVCDVDFKKEHKKTIDEISKKYWCDFRTFTLINWKSFPQYTKGKTSLYLPELDENKKNIPSTAFNEVCKQVAKGYEGFYALLKTSGLSGRPKPPNFKDSGDKGRNIVTLNEPRRCQKKPDKYIAVRFKADYVSRVDKQKYNIADNYVLRLPIPPTLKDVEITQLKIQPKSNGRYKLIFIHKRPDMEGLPPKSENPQAILGIDLGVSIVAACFNALNGDSFLIKGSKILSENKYFNEQKERLQGEIEKDGINKNVEQKYRFRNTKRLQRLSFKRTNVLNHEMNLIARQIVGYAVENGLHTIVIGENKGWKQNVGVEGRKKAKAEGKQARGLSRATNKKFVGLPYDKLKQKISSLCEQYNINFARNEESYTSKTSFLDKEFPKKKADNAYLGDRKKRSQFTSSDGKVIHADINGAAQITVKYLNKAHKGEIQYDYELTKNIVENPTKYNNPIQSTLPK